MAAGQNDGVKWTAEQGGGPRHTRTTLGLVCLPLVGDVKKEGAQETIRTLRPRMCAGHGAGAEGERSGLQGQTCHCAPWQYLFCGWFVLVSRAGDVTQNLADVKQVSMPRAKLLFLKEVYHRRPQWYMRSFLGKRLSQSGSVETVGTRRKPPARSILL